MLRGTGKQEHGGELLVCRPEKELAQTQTEGLGGKGTGVGERWGVGEMGRWGAGVGGGGGRIGEGV